MTSIGKKSLFRFSMLAVACMIAFAAAPAQAGAIAKSGSTIVKSRTINGVTLTKTLNTTKTTVQTANGGHTVVTRSGSIAKRPAR